MSDFVTLRQNNLLKASWAFLGPLYIFIWLKILPLRILFLSEQTKTFIFHDLGFNLTRNLAVLTTTLFYRADKVRDELLC